jgi:hypothetical protein
MRGIYSLAEELLASQEELCSMELVNNSGNMCIHGEDVPLKIYLFI